MRIFNINSADKKNKNGREAATLAKTFSIVFVVCLIAFTAVRVEIDKIANINPFDTDPESETVVLSESEELLSVLVTGDSPFFDIFTQSDRCNILFVGVNQGMSDTIMLASFDRKQRHLDVISVPRDTYVDIGPGHDDAWYKINAQYHGNIANLAKYVCQVLHGIPINYYAVIDYEGVKNIVNAMGGVPINITQPGGMHYSDPYDTPPLVIDIPEGEQVLDGEHAVQFLRYRKGYAMGDLGRVEAQQQFIKNAFKQCISLDLPNIVRTAFENVESDITIGVALDLAKHATGITSDDIVTYTIPINIQDGPPYYVFPRSEDISKMLAQIYLIGTDQGEIDGRGADHMVPDSELIIL